MFVGAHLATGLIIGKMSGDYTTALASSLLIDIDHLIPYVRHKVLWSPRKFWKAITSPEDPYGNQRNILHSIFSWAMISTVAMIINFEGGMVLALGYAGHLILDAADGSDFHPFFPIRWNLKGPIVYLSKSEIGLTFFLFIVFFAL